MTNRRYWKKKPASTPKCGWRSIGGKRIYARSAWEANYARYLEWLKSIGEIKDWQHEPKTFWFESIRRGVRSYKPDFAVVYNAVWAPFHSEKPIPSEIIHYHEVKGYMDAKSRTKLKRMQKYYPNEKVVLIDAKWFRANKILKSIVPEWE